MDKIKKFLNSELKNWSRWEVIWIIVANVIILGVSLAMCDSAIGIIASISGTLCVILTGMGKMSNFIFGMINIIFYAIVAYKATYYGDVMLNVFYYLLTNVIAWFMWKKNINNENGEVKKERLELKMQIIVVVLSVLGIVVYGYILSNFTNDALPYIDSMSTVLSITAQILLMKRCMEDPLILFT